MASVARKQDMPPPGGYRTINFARVPAKQYFSGYGWILGYAAMTTVSLYLYTLNYKKVKRNEIEMRSSRLALQPLLYAEQDREYLKQLRRNRDEEAKLMANVPGWEVGTYYGPRRCQLAKRIWNEVMSSATSSRGDKRLETILHGPQRDFTSMTEYERQFSMPASRCLPSPNSSAQNLLQAMSQHPLYGEEALTFWRHNLKTVQGATEPPSGLPSQPFRRSAAFTCPTELSLLRFPSG